MYDNDNDNDKAQAEELVTKVGAICKEYHPVIVLFVLEAALSAQIASVSPPLGDLFTEMMREYKSKAAILLTVAELLKGGANAIRNDASVEDLLAELGISEEDASVGRNPDGHIE